MSLPQATTVYSTPDGFWNAVRVTQLRQLFYDGLSNNQIAVEMGVRSRSAVIGKLHRLGLKRETMAISPQSRGARSIVARARKPKPARPLEAFVRTRAAPVEDPAFATDGVTDIAVETIIGRVPLLSATDTQCRWPAADDGSATMVCGDRIVAGSFCARHALRGYQRPGASFRNATG
jgi:GcrA cell cycle regulator